LALTDVALGTVAPTTVPLVAAGTGMGARIAATATSTATTAAMPTHRARSALDGAT
jgi:hypothetical protein